MARSTTRSCSNHTTLYIVPYQRQSPAVLQRGRKPWLATNHKNIYRYVNGWYLHKWFRGQRYAEYFSDVTYGDDETALRAAIVRRDWLDKYRKRILNKLGVEIARRVFGKRGRRLSMRARVLKVPIDIKKIVAAVQCDLDVLGVAREAAASATASPSATSE